MEPRPSYSTYSIFCFPLCRTPLAAVLCVALIASRQYRKYSAFPCLRRCVQPGTACRLFAARNYTAKNQLPKRQRKCLPQVARASRFRTILPANFHRDHGNCLQKLVSNAIYGKPFTANARRRRIVRSKLKLLVKSYFLSILFRLQRGLEERYGERCHRDQ